MNRKLVFCLTLFVLLSSLLCIRFEQVKVNASNGYRVHNLDTGLNYTKIQEAIDAPETSDGHTILVDSGIYNESVIIDKRVYLIGEQKTNTIINGYGAQWAVSITSNNATISRFTIRNGGRGLSSPIGLSNGGVKLVANGSRISENMIIYNNYSGIWSYSMASGNTIEDNFVSNNFYGVRLFSSFDKLINNTVANSTYMGVQISGEGNYLRRNYLDNNTYGFGTSGIHDIDESNMIDGKPIIYWIKQHDRVVPDNAGYVATIDCVNISVCNVTFRNLSTGIEFINTTSSVIRNVKILNCSFSNIHLLGSDKNIIANCTLVSNTGRYTYVLALRDSDDNTINDNIIRGGNVIMSGSPYGIGIDLYNCSRNVIFRNTLVNNWDAIFLTYSNTNRIYHNNFVNNVVPVPTGAIKESNEWDNGYSYGGNYWSNYDGIDILWGHYQNETGSDGIGDKPYIIDPENEQLDKYPLMGMFSEYPVDWANRTYHVNTICNSTISDFHFGVVVVFPDHAPGPPWTTSIFFNATGDTLGFCRIMIPKDVLDGEYVVGLDDFSMPPSMWRELPISNDTTLYLYLTYPSDSHKIWIMGTTMVPEFPSFLILPLFMIVSLLLVTFRKRFTDKPWKKANAQNSISVFLA